MTFPAVEATNTSVEATDVTAHDVSLPAAIAAGNLLLAILGNGGTFGGMSAEAGWTEELDITEATIESRMADGSEGATVTFDSASPTTSAHNSYRISTAHGDVDVATVGGSNDPPSLTPAWGVADTLWIAGLVTGDAGGDVDITAAPSGYSGLIKSSQVAGGLGINFRTATAWKQASAASENPGAFTVTTTVSPSPILAFTIAVRPAGSAGGARRSFGYIIGA